MKSYDVVIFGNYASDTIITKGNKRYADGGGFYYGAYAAAGLGVNVAVVTRLAKADSHVIDIMEKVGIDVYPTFTSTSTQMVLNYPSSNVDDRIISCPATAGSYTIDQFDGLKAKAFLISALIRDEVPVKVVEHLRSTKDGLLVADAQSFVRIMGPESRLINSEWTEKKTVLAMVDILKADAIEAESLTGEKDHRKAAKILAGWGPKEIVLTYRNGILVYAEGEFYEAEFHPQELIGRTGRGDTCIASYVTKRLSTPPSEAILWSAAVTSLKMEAEGPFLRPIEVVEELIRRKYKQP